MPGKNVFAKLLLVAIAGGLLIGHFLIHQFSIPAETALRISEGYLIADGIEPYSGFVDNATPFYLYLNTLPVLLSRIIYVHPIAITNLLVTCFVVLQGCLIALLGVHGGGRRRFSDLTIWAFLCAFLLIVLTQPVHFAQANQIFFLAFAPYLLCRAGRLKGISVPNNLAIICAAALCFACLIDALYWLYLLVFEVCLLLSFFPFQNRAFITKRYWATENKVIGLIFLFAQLGWCVLPAASMRIYFKSIMAINYWSFLEALRALNFFDTATDNRPLIFLAVLLLVFSLARARQNILVRLCAVASISGLWLMIVQGATLNYQTFLFVGFAALSFVSALVRHPILRQLPLPGLHIPLLMAARDRLFAFDPKRRPAFLLLTMSFCLAWFGVYGLEYILLKRAHRFDLTQLRYYGIADKRDLGILSETVEEFSRVDDSVAVLGIGVRPGYPVLTQLRRRPGLSLTWGFPIDTLHILEDPYHAKQPPFLNKFKKSLYDKMKQELSSEMDFPVLLLVDSDEVRRVLKEQDVYQFIDKCYDFLGGVSLLDVGDIDAHPKSEYVGYKVGFAIYRHK